MSNQQKTQFTLTELVSGLDVSIVGNADCLIHGVAAIQKAEPGQIAFLMNPLYKKHLATTNASAVILTKEDSSACPTNAIVCRDPYYIYAKIAANFAHKPAVNLGVHPSAVIGDECDIDPSASIGAQCVIGNGVKIGQNVIVGSHCSIGDFSEIDEGTVLHANVTLYPRVKVGKRVSISSGTVVGSDGFGIAKHDGVWHKVPQLGSVIIQDDVEIGANCAIDRGAIEDTIIGKGSKLDNLIQVGHNARIGEHVAIAGCVGIAGSATIGNNCLIGGGAGVGGHISIADNTMITGFTAVTKSIREAGVYSSGVGGVVTNLEWRKNSARLHRLEQLSQRIKTLEFVVRELIESKET